jgi:hypothetical protein
MKAMPVAVAVMLALACDQAAPSGMRPDPLQPLAFLAGHCFKGELANGKDVDEHCFAGESTYYRDSLAGRIEYLYIENEGGIMRGSVEPADGALVFPATSFVQDGAALTIRVRWTVLADGSYEAWSEMQDTHAWRTMFRLRMAKSP